MSRELIVIGAGGGSRELLGFVGEINAALAPAQRWRVGGVLDDDVSKQGRTIAGVPVVGTPADIGAHPATQVVIGIANHRDVTVRQRVFERLGLPERRYATLIHPRAYVDTSAAVGPDCILYPNVCVGPNVTLGCNTVVYFNTVIHHDCAVGPHSAICAGVCLTGDVTLWTCVYVSAAAVIRDGVQVGAEALVGMGAVVTKNVESGQTVCGVPARPLAAAEKDRPCSCTPAPSSHGCPICPSGQAR